MPSSPVRTSQLYEHLKLALGVSISLLLISAFRAPDGMEGLQSIVSKIKILIRFSVLGGLGFLLLTYVTRNRLKPQLLWHVPFFGFAGWGMVSVLWSARPDESFGQVISLLTLILVSLAVSIVLRRERDVSDAIRFITLNLMALCLFLLVTGILIPSSHHMTRNGMGLGHSTNSGSTASLGLVLLLGCGALWNWRWIRYLMVPGCLLFVSVALFSANRLSMAITVCMVPSLWLLYGSRRSLGIALVLAAVVGSVFLISDPNFSSISDTLQTVNRNQSADEISSFSGRQQMWAAMWTSFLTSPWIGHGYFLSSQTGELEVWYLYDELTGVNWTAHNLWLQAMVSTGMIGLALFLLAMLAPITALCLRACFNRTWQRIDSWFFILLFWYLLWGMLNESFLGPVQPESVVFFFVHGTLIARLCGNLKLESKTASGPTELKSRSSASWTRQEVLPSL
ncbi:MAG: O-antigen ligase family protein [Pirellulaceae bacterium]|nr:O-antigen ligase family protein [Pirellulaceae bacterium]